MVDVYQWNYAQKEAVYQDKVRCLQESWKQYQHVQIFDEKEFQEIGIERANLASCVSSIEVAHSVRERSAGSVEGYVGAYGETA